MTITYDPRHEVYTDEYDVRLEVARVFDICNGCRQCLSLCPTFPALVSSVESKPEADAGRLTPDEQDAVLGECFRCTLCTSSCPYLTGRHDAAVDFPRLVDRYRAMQKTQKKWSPRSSAGHFILGRSRRAVRFIVRRKPDGIVRQFLRRTVGISQYDVTHSVAYVRLHTSATSGDRSSSASESRVALFPTCIVEALEPRVTQEIIDRYQQNGAECSLVGTQSCCGAPALLNGEMNFFVKHATRMVAMLSDAVRNGSDIVVAHQHCCSVISHDYPHYVDSDDARLVASHVSVARGGVGTDDAGLAGWWALHVDNQQRADALDRRFSKKPPTD